jgi:hypothetical protein
VALHCRSGRELGAKKSSEINDPASNDASQLSKLGFALLAAGAIWNLGLVVLGHVVERLRLRAR